MRIQLFFFIACHFLLNLFSPHAFAQVIEINGSPFATEGAPLTQHFATRGEKMIVVDPMQHVYGAYGANGKLIRWGIATAGAESCRDAYGSCQTRVGRFRIYSLGNAGCVSKKYDSAPMPFCMFFAGGQAVHGSSDVEFGNSSHGCVRVHVDDAKWLRYHFVQAPTLANHFRGTLVLVQPYQ